MKKMFVFLLLCFLGAMVASAYEATNKASPEVECTYLPTLELEPIALTDCWQGEVSYRYRGNYFVQLAIYGQEITFEKANTKGMTAIHKHGKPEPKITETYFYKNWGLSDRQARSLS